LCVDPADVSDAVLWPVSNEARRVTGIALPVDARATAPYEMPHLTD
jgi:(+)-trans-carveol dehydrogenase